MIKKIILLVFIPFIILVMGIMMMTNSTVTTTTNSRNSDTEETFDFHLEGLVSQDTLKEINFVEKANADESYCEITGTVNSGKITNSKYITWRKGNLELVTVGNGGNGEGLNGTITTSGGAEGAAQWARAIAADDSFEYGEGRRAHRTGCYFCGTNTGPKLKKKERKGEPHTITGYDGKKHTYEKTYCCNTFVTACYAHGANDPAVLKRCKRGGCCGLTPGKWTNTGSFKYIGHPSYSDLKTGDVLLKVNKHAAIYVGNGEYAEATGNKWGSQSIRVKPLTKKKYSKFGAVCRYTGNGAGGTTITTSGGTISGSSGSGVRGALDWAKKIADDNSYTYRCVNTCHLCHSNAAKHYCCASFVRAAYAHGAGDSTMMTACEKSQAGAVAGLVKAMKSSGNFKNMGNLKESQLQPGDVLVKMGSHVEMYYGNGKMVGAHGIEHNTAANSISVTKYRHFYNQVWRYKIGGGSVASNPTYTKKKILAKISKSDLTNIGSCGNSGQPTAQSLEYLGNGRTAVVLNNTKPGNDFGSSGKIIIFKDGKQQKSGSSMNLGHANGMGYADGNLIVGTKRNNWKQVAKVPEKSLSSKSQKVTKFRVLGLGHDSDTGNMAISDGGKITITNSDFSVKNNSFQKIVSGGHTQDCGAKRGVVYECISYDKHNNNLINMYNESTGGYLGSYKINFDCELEGCDVDEEGHLIILVHIKGSKNNYLYKTKAVMALTESQTAGNGMIEGLTIRQYLAISIRYKKNAETSKIPFQIAEAKAWAPSQENLQIANKIAAALAQRGYTKESIAGVLGNLHHESAGLKTSAIEGNGGGGHGLAQWTGGRWTNLQRFASARGKSWKDLDVQIQFLCHELDSYKGMEQKLRNCSSVEEATKIFMDEFERPDSRYAALSNRIKYAKGYYGNTTAKGTSNCEADLLVSVDTDVNKCIVQGTLNGHKIEAAGDIMYDGKQIILSAQGLGQSSDSSGEFVAGQLSGMRTSYPESGNKWYFDKSINPFPRNSRGGNCTWYAYGRFCEIAGKKIPMSHYGNAVTFYDSFPSCQKGKTPQVGAIICWGYGSAHGNPGHVAVVEEVKSNGDIVCSNSGWSGSKFWMSTHKKSDNYSMHHNNDVFRGFIYQP